MGGESASSPSSTGNYLVNSDVSSDDDRSYDKVEENNSPSNGKNGLMLGEFSGLGPLDKLLTEAEERQKAKVYSEVMKNYEDLQSRIHSLEKAKKKVLCYKPGLWADSMESMDLSHSQVPQPTTLLVIGPKGSGKSSLVNTISRVLETDEFVSGRAQVSCDSSRDGTCFLYEYMIPKGSGSFCLYDTRSLSDDLRENEKMFGVWMTKGVCHGELVVRKSDNSDLKARMKQKVRSLKDNKVVNFVIFVVSGVSVLESMISPDGNKTEYSQFIAANFHSAVLSFQDDKPVVVVTHCDLLPLALRIKIRIFLGSLLGIPPATQIFDIPDNEDPATAMAVLNMLTYTLEHADRYMHSKNLDFVEASFTARALFLFAAVALLMVLAFLYIMCLSYSEPFSEPDLQIEWHKIRHLWSD